MRAVLQRVTHATVTIDTAVCAQVGPGLLVLLGIAAGDEEADAAWLAQKIAAMRIFSDSNGLMNLDIAAVSGDILVVSQFTLMAAYQKGARPSFIRAARPEVAVPLYEFFLSRLAQILGKPPKAGIFGADMKVALVNDGPVTIIMDSKARE